MLIALTRKLESIILKHLAQLQKYYGAKVHKFTHYDETVWKNELFASLDYQTLILPHQNNGHKLYQQAYLNISLSAFSRYRNKSQFGGYI